MPSAVPVAVRVRRVLKYALRAQGLRLVSLAEPGVGDNHKGDADGEG
jgi:hypothetical protein